MDLRINLPLIFHFGEEVFESRNIASALTISQENDSQRSWVIRKSALDLIETALKASASSIPHILTVVQVILFVEALLTMASVFKVNQMDILEYLFLPFREQGIRK